MRRHQKIDRSQVKIPIYDHFYIKTCFPSYYVRCNYFVTKATEVSLVTLSGASITTGNIHPRQSVLNSLLVPAWLHHQFGSTTNALSMPPAMHQQATSTCATPALVNVDKVKPTATACYLISSMTDNTWQMNIINATKQGQMVFIDIFIYIPICSYVQFM